MLHLDAMPIGDDSDDAEKSVDESKSRDNANGNRVPKRL
jgi:hypothetical protein